MVTINMRCLSVALLSMLMIGCAATKKGSSESQLFTLNSISTYGHAKSNSENEVFAQIELSRQKPNMIGVFNFCTYKSFFIRRRDIPSGAFSTIGILKSSQTNLIRGQPPCQIAIYIDHKESSIHYRYQIIPVVRGEEQTPIAIRYVTKEKETYEQIEGLTKQIP